MLLKILDNNVYQRTKINSKELRVCIYVLRLKYTITYFFSKCRSSYVLQLKLLLQTKHFIFSYLKFFHVLLCRFNFTISYVLFILLLNILFL